jgi:hypothetical protein
MARRDKGKPSGGNKSEGTGMPSSFTPRDTNNDRRQTRKYTDESDELIGRAPMRHPNRNTGKPNPTNAGGYKN